MHFLYYSFIVIEITQVYHFEHNLQIKKFLVKVIQHTHVINELFEKNG